MSAAPIEAIARPMAWSASDFESIDELGFEFQSKHCDALDRALNQVLERSLGVDDIGVVDFPLPEMQAELASLRQEVKYGRGIVIIRGFPVGKYSMRELEIAYWGFGSHLGVGSSQSVMGDKVGHVRDTSATDPNARAYRNKQSLTLHTDLCDFICMLSVSPAKSGGVSRYASALDIHNHLLRQHRDSLEILYRGFQMYRLGEQGPDEDPCTPWRVPVFSNCEGFVSCRWLRAYIEAAPVLLQCPLTDDEMTALDHMDSAAERDGTVLERLLKPGEMTITNNYTVLHSRTTFEDDAANDVQRRLLRLWLNGTPGRPVVPEIDLFAQRGVPRQIDQKPSGEGELLQKMIRASRSSRRE